MKENQNSVRLNFYPLKSQEFKFTVWRKEYRGEKKEGIFEALYRNTLPIQDDPEQRKDYWVSFQPLNDFEEYVCMQDTNHKLTLAYLYYCLRGRTSEKLARNKYIVPENEFRKRLFFVLKEYEEGKQTVWLEPYYLHHPDGGKFGFLADFAFHKNPNVPFNKEVQRLSLSLDSKYRSNRNFYIDKYEKLQIFLAKYRNVIFPLKNDDGSSLDIEHKLQEIQTRKLETKKYVFYNEETDISQFRGLSDHGPYEPVVEPIVLVFIYRKNDKFMVSNLYKALNGNFRDVAFKGITPVMRLRVGSLEKIQLNSYTEVELAHAVERIRQLAGQSPPKLMPILIADEEDSRTYYYMKYHLLKERIPLQNVTLELIRSRNSFKWAVSNIALALLAKLGGKPWKVKPSHERSLIFGIGQSHQKHEGKIVKYFAYSVCTDSSGLYKKISVLGKSDDEATYLRQLRRNIISTVKEHLDNGYNKYVLHVPFKIKRNELSEIYEAIRELSNERGQDNADFVVLRVDPDNKYFGYAHTNSLIPFESTYLKLSHNPRPAYLIWFEGLQYHRGAIHKRIPGPVYVEFYWTNRELDESEREKYLQDVLNLSGANWRGFNAKNLPISVYYCQLIAKFLKNFPGEIENLDDVKNPWFL